MKKITSLLVTFLFLSTWLFSQIPLTVLPSGGNKKAAVSEQIGLTNVTIHYDRPAVKGREGKVWGQLVHAGYIDQQFGSSKAAPWRAGANENTTIEFTTPVKINGQSLPAGKYGFFIAYDPNESTIIFSKNSTSWGSYFYDASEDALRIKVKPQPLSQSVEWLKYEFRDETENSATVAMEWEKLSFPFKIEVDYVNDQLASFRRELRSEKGFIWQSWNQAAQWCLQRNVNLEEALKWADSATSTNFGGDKAYGAWVVKAQLLDKLGRSSESADVMKSAMAFAGMNDVHQYGRLLIQQKKTKEALEVFQTNYKKYPNTFTTLIGMMRGYSAVGDYKNALKYGTQALPLSPANQKAGVEGMVQKLKEGKDIN